MALDTLGRDPAEQLAVDRGIARDQQPSAEARTDFAPVRERPPRDRPPQELPPGGKLPGEARDQDEEQDREDSDEPRNGLLRRHPIALAIVLLLLLVALPFGYLYWNLYQSFRID